jgi:GNAT superfamily N-acetyltransferase
MKVTQSSNKVARRFLDVSVEPFSKTDFSETWLLWKTQYEEELSTVNSMPHTWKSNRKEIESFLEKRVKSDYAIVAKHKNAIIGYMLFDAFPFHGETTAFCPIVGHAAKKVCRRQIYEKLYQTLSKKLVADGTLNHVITYFAHDEGLKETVFELGFGLIVIDAFRGLDTFSSGNSSVNIVQADPSHLEAIEALGEESRSYYLEAPLFLTREKRSRDYYRSLFDEDSAIFLAFNSNEPVGFMQIRKDKKSDPIILSDLNTGLIDQLGAYIKPTYRHQGIGRALLLKCLQWCKHHDITQIHVDFESANLSGKPFWLRYFTATMHSARRAIYRDVPRT